MTVELELEAVEVETASGGQGTLAIGIAAALGTAAGAWMAGGLFQGPAARGVGLIGVLIGAGLVTAGFRLRRELVAQLLVLPAAAVAGALLVLPETAAGVTLPALVGHAVRGGGFLQPPVPFDPGWRFLLVVLCAAVAATSASLALASARPKLAVAVPMALVIPAALLQPDSAELLSAGGAIALAVLALAAARNAELAALGRVNVEFELNRLARSGAVTAALLVALVLISRAGLLFPTTQHDQVIPPHRPQVAAQPPDQVLFTYRATRSVPLRLGVLDTYDGRGWLLPAFDPAKLAQVQPGARFPEAPAGSGTVRIEVTLGSLEGRSLPAPAGLVRLDGTQSVQFDLATQTLLLAGRSDTPGVTYGVDAAPPPASKLLEAAGPPPADMRAYLSVPAPPAEVVRLLAQAPNDRYDRLQYLREALYQKVVAAGEGRPVDVPPSRVGAMLDGAHASPYEITAAEALLARWAGVPSRIGYGYDGGEALPDGSVAVHPVHAGTWLEAYFSGPGWVPLVGVPPHAAASLNAAKKNLTEGAQTAQNLSLVLYVPVLQSSRLLLYEEARYYLVRALPVLLVLALLVVAFPALLKLLRSRRRRRWARRGPRERIAAAYADLRDRCRDLGIGDPAAPPLDFLAELQPDDQHTELAWLVTRALWGDLRRELRAEDAEAAELMARSLRRRVTGAQPLATRAVAWISRASLRSPYSEEVPNAWPRRGARAMRTRRRLLAPAGAAGLTVSLLALGVLVTVPAAAVVPAPPRHDQLGGLVPTGFGRLELHPEPSATSVFRHVAGSVVSAGRVYSVRHDGIVEGSVQVEQLVGSLQTGDQEVRRGIEQSLGGGSFHQLSIPVVLFDGGCLCPGTYTLVPVRNQALHRHQSVLEEDLPDLRVYLWFPPRRDVLVVVALRKEFTEQSSDALVLALLDRALGVPPGPVPIPESA